jgi:hypothetical protein
MLNFSARVVKEGSKSSSMRIAIPAAMVPQLGFVPPGWVRLQVNDGDAFFAYARRPPSRNTVEVGITQRLFPLSMAGSTVRVQLEDASPWRTSPTTARVGFDWLPFVTEHYFPEEAGDGRV